MQLTSDQVTAACYACATTSKQLGMLQRLTFTYCACQILSPRWHAQVKVMESKLPWIIYNREFEKLNACKEQKDNAKKGLEERKQQYEMSQAPIRYCHA